MQCLDRLTENEKRTLKLQVGKYFIIQDELWWRNLDGMLLKCVDHARYLELLIEFHGGVCGGNYMENTISHKILREGFW
jgi:hypothetical protein